MKSCLCTLAQEGLVWQTRTGLKERSSRSVKIKTAFAVTSTALDNSRNPFYVLISLETMFFFVFFPSKTAEGWCGLCSFSIEGFSGGSAPSAECLPGHTKCFFFMFQQIPAELSRNHFDLLSLHLNCWAVWVFYSYRRQVCKLYCNTVCPSIRKLASQLMQCWQHSSHECVAQSINNRSKHSVINICAQIVRRIKWESVSLNKGTCSLRARRERTLITPATLSQQPWRNQ